MAFGQTLYHGVFILNQLWVVTLAPLSMIDKIVLYPILFSELAYALWVTSSFSCSAWLASAEKAFPGRKLASFRLNQYRRANTF